MASDAADAGNNMAQGVASDIASLFSSGTSRMCSVPAFHVIAVLRGLCVWLGVVFVTRMLQRDAVVGHA